MCETNKMQDNVNTSELSNNEMNIDSANRKEYICDLCGLKLFSRSGIHRHMKHKHLGLKTTHSTQPKTEICTICGVYTTRRNFKDHVNSHSTARNYKCDFCGSAVKSIFTLRKHMKRVHLKTKSSESSSSDM